MSIVKSTLSKELEDGGVIYIYPRTSSDIVIYDDDESVKQKIDDIVKKLNYVGTEVANARISLYDNKLKTSIRARLEDDFKYLEDMIHNISSFDNTEIVNARTAKSDDKAKSNLKTRIDADYVALSTRIKVCEDAIITDEHINSLINTALVEVEYGSY